jgi:glycosyltransferase involved in cell wall biosynthesis
MSDEKILEKRIGEKVARAPLVSVIIPAYNVAEFIIETLESVFAQTFSGYEIIVVNDGSPDTEKMEKALAPYFEKIVYIKQRNGGAAAARNAAIAAARGALLAFLDGDDIWLPEYLASQIAALEEKKCDLVYCDARLFGGVSDSAETFMGKSPSRGRVTTENLISARCNVITSGTLARRETIVEAGMFDAEMSGMEDFDLWFRLAKRGARLDYQTKVLLKYRVRPDSQTGSNVNRAARTVAVYRAIQKKYDFSESEQAAMKKQMRLAEAELALETAKLEIVKGNYRAARTLLREANDVFRKPKLTLIGWLLAFNPQLVLKMFQRFRPAELNFIAPHENKNH